MYDHFIGKSKFYEIKSLIQDYIDYGKEYNDLSLEEIGDRAFEYYQNGDMSSSQYDYLISMIEDWE